MASQRHLSGVPKMAGPAGGRILTCKFSVAGAALTALEEMGCTVARSGVGTYVVTLNRAYKNVVANLTIQRAAGAMTQSVWITSSTTTTLTLTQFTSADGTPVDTLTFTAHLTIHGRANA